MFVEDLSRQEIYNLLIEGVIDFSEFMEWCDKQERMSHHESLGGETENIIWLQNNGYQPVPNGTLINIKFRNGEVFEKDIMADHWNWKFNNHDYDIISYKVS